MTEQFVLKTVKQTLVVMFIDWVLAFMARIYVYILECEDKSYYVGVTNNLERRLFEHNAGIDPNAYTWFRRPVNIIFHRKFRNPYEAIALEKKLKGWSREKKEAFIAGDWDRIKLLAKCKNSTKHDRPNRNC